jgi:multidrug efflux system membrane fusion protein
MRFGPLLTVIFIAGAAAAGWYWLNDEPLQSEAPRRGEGRRSVPRDTPVPVTVEAVKLATVPVYREGIGNVQALYTVTVRAQIDGRLISVDFVEGQHVRKGDVLARIDPPVYKAQYDQAVAKRAQDQATLANARIDLQRYSRLAQTNAGPQQQADQQAALVAQLEAQVKSDDAAMDNAKAYLDYTLITSPIDARTGLRLVDPGNVVHAADANGLVSLTQITPIATVFTLPQRDLPAIAAALARGKVQVEVVEAAGRNVLAGGVLQTIDNQIDVTTGTIKLKAVFPNEDERLWPGQFVSVRVVVDTLIDAKVVAASAIRRGPNGTFVYTVGADAKAAVRRVDVLLQDEARAVIGSGVAAGERLVTVGFAQLTDGKAVQIAPEAMPPNVEPNAERRRLRSEGGERRRHDDRGRAGKFDRKQGTTQEAAQ